DHASRQQDLAPFARDPGARLWTDGVLVHAVVSARDAAEYAPCVESWKHLVDLAGADCAGCVLPGDREMGARKAWTLLRCFRFRVLPLLLLKRARQPFLRISR